MKKLIFALFVAGISLAAKPIVTTTILPTKYFVEKIAGDSVKVNAMVGAGADPHTYEPKPSQMKDLEKSDLYFAIGIEFDDVYLPKLTSINPKLKVIETQSGITFAKIHHHHDHDHHHSPHDADHHHDDHDHDHEMVNDPHIWLDPVLVEVQARNIKDALVAQYPKNKEMYEKNYSKFLKELKELDSYAKTKLKDVKNRIFLINHPSFGYFATRYNLVQVPIEVEGKEPKPADLANLIKKAKESGAKVVFSVSSLSPKQATFLADQIGAKVVKIDVLPLNWGKSMKEIIDIFAKNLD